MIRRPARILIAGAAALSLSACFSLGGKVPDMLMTLSPAVPAQADAGRTVAGGEAITVLVPTVAQTLAAPRVPVLSGGGTSLAYVKDAVWAEAPNRLFRNLLAEVIASQTGRPVLDARQYSLAPGPRLGGRLAMFGIDAQSNEAVVTYDATLEREDQPLRTRRFEARVPVSAIDAPNAGRALNVAANAVATQVSAWVGR